MLLFAQQYPFVVSTIAALVAAEIVAHLVMWWITAGKWGGRYLFAVRERYTVDRRYVRPLVTVTIFRYVFRHEEWFNLYHLTEDLGRSAKRVAAVGIALYMLTIAVCVPWFFGLFTG